MDSEPTVVDIALIPAYVVVILVGIIGNLLVITVVKKNKAMHTTANLLLANLALADLITLIWCPPGLIMMFIRHPGGNLGDYMCKFVTKHHLAGITLLTSGFTLTLISFERYNALLRPMNLSLRLTKGGVARAIVVMWVLGFMFVLPLFVKERYNETLQMCEILWEDKAAAIYWVTLAVLVVVCFFTMAFCYLQIIRGFYFTKTICAANSTSFRREDDRSKRRIVNLLLTVTAVFMSCFLPFVAASALPPVSTSGAFYKVSTFLVYCSCSLNPIVYTCQSSNYRNAFKKLLLKP